MIVIDWCVLSQVQILGYNSDLYGNMTQAIQSSNGLVMLALLVKVISLGDHIEL